MKVKFEINNEEELNELKRIIQYYECGIKNKERENIEKSNINKRIKQKYINSTIPIIDNSPLSIENCNF